MKIRGVNLGNWLVLEKWIKPDMFKGNSAEDETYLCKTMPIEEKLKCYQEHREHFIQEEDFAFLAEVGFNTVRIPVPYFLFDGMGVFVPCVEYLDRAFDWAEKYDLKILVDLHTVPGGHNGTDNSGICGICTWSTKQEYLEITLNVLERIAQRYGRREGLWGIEALNEPMCSDTPIAQFMNIQMLGRIYPPAEPELAEANTNYSLEYLQNFYRNAYQKMRPYMEDGKKIVFSDAFYLEGWEAFFHEENLHDIVLDTHQYLVVPEAGFGEDRPFIKYEAYLKGLAKQMRSVTSRLPVIVGEWSLSNKMTGCENASSQERSLILQKLCSLYQEAVDSGEGWFYWTYKVDNPDPRYDVWDLRRCLKEKWLSLDSE